MEIAPVLYKEIFFKSVFPIMIHIVKILKLKKRATYLSFDWVYSSPSELPDGGDVDGPQQSGPPVGGDLELDRVTPL